MQNIIHPHHNFIRTHYAECALVFQLIQLLNNLKTDKNDTILEKIALNISYFSLLHM